MAEKNRRCPDCEGIELGFDRRKFLRTTTAGVTAAALGEPQLGRQWLELPKRQRLLNRWSRSSTTRFRPSRRK